MLFLENNRFMSTPNTDNYLIYYKKKVHYQSQRNI